MAGKWEWPCSCTPRLPACSQSCTLENSLRLSGRSYPVFVPTWIEQRRHLADQSLLSHHLHYIVNNGRTGLRELWWIDCPCLCGCAVVTDRKAFWMLLMLTTDWSLNLPVGVGAQQTSSICDVGSFKPTWTLFLESLLAAFLTTLSLPLLRCWKPTCCSSVCHSSIQSLASTCTTSCLLSGPNGWRVSSKHLKVPMTKETEGGDWEKNLEQKRGWRAGETEEKRRQGQWWWVSEVRHWF